MESKLPKFACFSNQILNKKEAIDPNFKIDKCMYYFKMLPIIFIAIFKILRKKLVPYYSYFLWNINKENSVKQYVLLNLVPN